MDRLKTELCRDAGVLLIRISWQKVNGTQQQAQTALYLEGLLEDHDVAFTSVVTRVQTPVDAHGGDLLEQKLGPSRRTTTARPDELKL